MVLGDCKILQLEYYQFLIVIPKYFINKLIKGGMKTTRFLFNCLVRYDSVFIIIGLFGTQRSWYRLFKFRYSINKYTKEMKKCSSNKMQTGFFNKLQVVLQSWNLQNQSNSMYVSNHRNKMPILMGLQLNYSITTNVIWKTFFR